MTRGERVNKTIMNVSLTKFEKRLAKYIAIWRLEESEAAALPQKFGKRTRDFNVEYVGALAEIAAAKALDVYPVYGVNAGKGADISRAIQVRGTTATTGVLIFRPGDPYGVATVLVILDRGGANVAGWMTYDEAEKRGQWRELAPGRPKCLCVSQADLFPLQDLVQLIHLPVSIPMRSMA